ncbi:hypothetical protein M0805_007765 [Coniferiporia weirii]|nr:hypothetical protein M0805_007765 [Coniferiporia weirii]
MTDKTPPIPRIDLSGTPYEIGFQHGTLLRAPILSQLAIYRTIFKALANIEWAQALEVARAFQPTVQRLAPDLYREIEGIAAGVQVGVGDGDGGLEGVTLLDILALNARSEIALGTLDDGCTSLAWALKGNSHRQVLAQNWDWTEDVGKNLAMASITQPGKPKIWMVIEPGIVGKIGFNSASVGVCLNAIRASALSTALLPIHLLLRVALECTSVAAAIAELERLGGPASSQHVLIADATPSARGLELSPHGSAYLAPDEHGIVVHTNHFLENKVVREVAWLSGSPVRLARVRELCAQIQSDFSPSGEGVLTPALLRERVFSDRSGAPQAICCQMEAADGRAIGTLFNIVMQFAQGVEPSAEVLFGRPGPENTSVVYKMPW